MPDKPLDIVPEPEEVTIGKDTPVSTEPTQEEEEIEVETTVPEPEPEEPKLEVKAEAEEEPPPPPEKKPTRREKRIDQLVFQREEALRKAEYYRGLAEGQPRAAPEVKVERAHLERPDRDDFDDEDNYIEALTDWRVEQRLIERDAERAEDKATAELEESRTHFQDKLAKGLELYEDFEETAYNPALQINGTIIDALKTCEYVPQIVYHLGKDPKETARIARLSPMDAAREIGKIEAQFIRNPGSAPPPTPPKKKSNAPPPITPVKESTSFADESIHDMDHEKYRRFRMGKAYNGVGGR